MAALQKTGRQLLALVLPLLLVGTGLMGPTLDRGLFRDGPVVEAEHDPSTCPVGHDHTLCSQAGAGRWLPAEPSAPRFSFQRALPSASPAGHVPSIGLRDRSVHPRAPPPS